MTKDEQVRKVMMACAEYAEKYRQGVEEHFPYEAQFIISKLKIPCKKCKAKIAEIERGGQ